MGLLGTLPRPPTGLGSPSPLGTAPVTEPPAAANAVARAWSNCLVLCPLWCASIACALYARLLFLSLRTDRRARRRSISSSCRTRATCESRSAPAALRMSLRARTWALPACFVRFGFVWFGSLWFHRENGVEGVFAVSRSTLTSWSQYFSSAYKAALSSISNNKPAKKQT